MKIQFGLVHTNRGAIMRANACGSVPDASVRRHIIARQHDASASVCLLLLALRLLPMPRSILHLTRTGPCVRTRAGLNHARVLRIGNKPPERRLRKADLSVY
jgi:hypothetical protein